MQCEHRNTVEYNNDLKNRCKNQATVNVAVHSNRDQTLGYALNLCTWHAVKQVDISVVNLRYPVVITPLG